MEGHEARVVEYGGREETRVGAVMAASNAENQNARRDWSGKTSGAAQRAGDGVVDGRAG